MKNLSALATAVGLLLTPAAWSAPVTVTFEATGPDAASIFPIRDSFRAAVGGGTVSSANGSFGGLRREINWDGVPAMFSDPNPFPANFFNSTSPRGVEYGTPGTGFLVSANAGDAQPTLFGFGDQLQVFSAQKLFTAVNSNITDVHFFLPGTATPATTTAFGVVFTGVEVAGGTKLEFFDQNNSLIYAHDAPVSGNDGLSFLGATVDGGTISWVRITSGINTIVSNSVLGNPNADLVAMDDFIYAEPAKSIVPEPASMMFIALGLLGGLIFSRPRVHRP